MAPMSPPLGSFSFSAIGSLARSHLPTAPTRCCTQERYDLSNKFDRRALPERRARPPAARPTRRCGRPRTKRARNRARSRQNRAPPRAARSGPSPRAPARASRGAARLLVHHILVLGLPGRLALGLLAAPPPLGRDVAALVDLDVRLRDRHHLPFEPFQPRRRPPRPVSPRIAARARGPGARRGGRGGTRLRGRSGGGGSGERDRGGGSGPINS